MTVTRSLFVLSTAALAASTAWGQNWVNYVNQTSTRLVVSPSFQNDNLEKDFEWGDFDQDGDVDLVVMRKFPGSIQGGFPNLLLMNENGILVDRTAEYGSAADVDGDLGLMAPTNDRECETADVNGDGWLDLVTVTTMSDNQNSIIGQPRVYINLGNDGDGNWQGFRFEDARIPVLFAKNGSAANPRFCDGVVVDLTGDGYPDIFFVDYDTPETSGTVCIDLNGDGDTNDPGECQQSPGETSSKDYDNKFLVNWGEDPNGPGPGYFFDTTNTRFTSSQLASAFGNAVLAADMNGDGFDDIVRVNTLTGGQNVATFYAKENDLGNSFSGPDQAVGNAPYNIGVGDLNNDGKLDLVVADDSKDKYLINTGNGADGFANFTSFTINDSLSEFGNTINLADLDNDGNVDVMIADVDADLPPFCPNSGRRAHIYRNIYVQGGSTSGILDEVGQIIPNGSLSSTFDIAPIDINGDGFIDLVTGRCAGIEVWMNQPPMSIAFAYPNGLPTILTPGEPLSFEVETAIEGGGSIIGGGPKLFTQINDGPWESSDLTGGPQTWMAQLPATECGQQVHYYLSAQLSSNNSFYTDPETAPSSFFQAIPRTEVLVAFSDHFEGDTSGWTVQNLGGLVNGAWEVADPNGTVSAGSQVSPDDDYDFDGTKAFVTMNGPPGGSAGTYDVDLGPTVLTSPNVNVGGYDTVSVSFAAWVFCSDAANPPEADFLVVEASSDGGQSWQTLDSIGDTGSQWSLRNYDVTSVFGAIETLQLRFSAADTPNNSTMDAHLDAVEIQAATCNAKSACPADLTGDGIVGGADLAMLLGNWGGSGVGDLNASGSVDGADLANLLGSWGDCL